MRVIAIMDWIVSPVATVISEGVKEGGIYTIKGEISGYSNYAKRWVDAYEFYEVAGYFEQGIFIPLSEIDETVNKQYEKQRI